MVLRNHILVAYWRWYPYFFSFMELVNQRKLVCYLFLSKLDFGRVNEEYKSLLSSQEVQVQFVQSVLRGATFMPTQFIIKSLEALPTPQNLRLVVFSLIIGQFSPLALIGLTWKPIKSDLVANCGSNLDLMLWIFSQFELNECYNHIQAYVTGKSCDIRSDTRDKKEMTVILETFKNVTPSGDTDSNNLSESDLEAFLIGTLCSISQSSTLGLPFITSHWSANHMQHHFFNAVLEIRGTNVSKSDLVNFRNTIRNVFKFSILIGE